MPAQKRRSRPEPAHEAARPPLNASNETSLAFLGVQRRAWMTTTVSAVPVVARPKSCAQSRRRNHPPSTICAPEASAPPSGTTVFPSPVNSSVSSPEASTSGPGAASSPSITHASPRQPPLSATADSLPASQAPSPPFFDVPSARLPGDARVPSASLEGSPPVGETAEASRVLTSSGPIASCPEDLPTSTTTCMSHQSNAPCPAENPATPQDESALVLRPTQPNLPATGNNSTPNNGPASTLTPTQSNVPSGAESLTTAPQDESTSALMPTHSNGPGATASLITPRHELNPYPIMYQQNKSSTADNHSTHFSEPALIHGPTKPNSTSPTENHLTRFNRPPQSLMPAPSNVPSAVTNQPTPHNQPAPMPGMLPGQVPDRQQKRHCSNTSRQEVASSPVLGVFPINFHQLTSAIEDRLRKSEGAGLQENHTIFYRMLGSACVRGDLFYLVFHQAFCLWSLNHSSAYTFLNASPQVVDSAFHILLQIWRQNSDLPLAHLHWFAAFPVFINTTIVHGRLISRDQASSVMPLINTFLKKLALSCGLVLVQVAHRGYPLMAWEFKYILQCPSPVLRWALFTCSRRSFGILDDSSTQTLSRLFEMDSRTEYSQSVETPELIQARMNMRDRYLAVLQRWTGHPPNNRFAVNHTQQHLGTQNAQFAQQHSLPPLTSQSSRPPPNTSPASFAPHNAGSYPLATYGPVMDGNANAGQMPMGFTQPHPAPFNSSGSTAQAGPGQRTQVLTPLMSPNEHFSQASPYLTQTRAASNSSRAPMMPAVQRPMSSVQNSVAPTLPASIPPTHAPGSPYLQQQQAAHRFVQPATTWSHPTHASRVVQPRPNSRPAITSGQTGLRAPPREPSQHQVVPLDGHEIPRDDWSRAQNGLHLSYLRSPERNCAMPTSKHFYQFVAEFAAVPQAFPPQPGLRDLRFSVSQLQLSKLLIADSASEVPMALVFNGSLRYRLRMCKQKQTTQKVEESSWTGCGSFWPPHIFLACNEQHVQPRRRQHSGFDLPIELTGLLKSGENTVQVSLPRFEGNIDQHWTYFMAVEVISILDHGTVRGMVLANSRTSVDEFKRDVVRRLKPDGSDDIIAESDHICVSVTDPFSSCLFTIPVRGADCKHLECFDLEIWLRTRAGKHSREPSAVDSWKCPICDVDARPISLHIDDFFTEVRAKLVQDGDNSVKKITIHSDGTWSPLVEADEPRDEAQQASAPDQERPVGAQATISEPLQEVIVIDDD